MAEFLHAAETLRQPKLRYLALSRRSTLAIMSGRFDEAEWRIAEAAALAAEIGEPDAIGVRIEQLWEIRGAQGRRGELAAEAAAAGLDQDSIEARGFATVALLEQGRREEAEAMARPLLELAPDDFPRNYGWTVNLTYAAEILAALGSDEQRRRTYEALAPLEGGAAVIGAAVAFKGAVAHHLGLLAAAMGAREAAVAHFERALALHRRLGAHPWALRSSYELGRLLEAEPATAERGRAILAEVAAAARRLGMPRLAEAAARSGPRSGAPAGGTFRRDGALWTLGWDGTSVRMRDAKGLADIAALLAAPGRQVRAADLVAASGSGGAARADLLLGADEVLDERARRELRQRLADLEEEIDEAERWADPDRAARARLERDTLVDELAAATGLGGRARRLGDQSERARKAVTARIRDVIARIERVHPALAAHLRASVTTGTFCTYSPASPTSWELGGPQGA